MKIIASLSKESGKDAHVGTGPTGSSTRAAIDGRAAFWKVVASLLLAIILFQFDQLEPFISSGPPTCYPAHDTKGIDLAKASDRTSTTSEQNSNRLFGLDTEPVTGGALLEKWLSIEATVAKDLEIIAQCLTNEPCPAPAQKLIGLSRAGAGRGERTRVGLINRAVDLAIRPMSDETQWGITDRWSDPFETLQSSSGDCEDYAIVKYAALRAAGLPRDAVKLVILTNRFPNEDHAVAAVWVDNQWLILDNRTLTLVRDTDVTRAIPRFVLDERGVRRFVVRSRNPRQISATSHDAIPL